MSGGGGLVAQRVQVSGQVLYGPRDRPLANAWVVLHQVRMQGQGGPMDSTRTETTGRFTLTIPRLDSTAMYVASSWYDGIAYFSEPVARGRPAVTLQPIHVYDTASTGPRVRVDRRLVTVARPSKDGTRGVLELLELTNPGPATRVTNDTGRPNWVGALPHGVIQFAVGQGDLSGDVAGQRGDSVIVVGPIPPGDPKQLTYSYTLPGTTAQVTIPIDQPMGELDLLLEDTATAVAGPGLEPGGVQVIEQRRFATYRGRGLAPPTSVELVFPRGSLGAQSLVPYVVALVALALAGGLAVALRRKPAGVGPRPSGRRKR